MCEIRIRIKTVIQNFLSLVLSKIVLVCQEPPEQPVICQSSLWHFMCSPEKQEATLEIMLTVTNNIYDVIEIFFWNTTRKEICFHTSQFKVNSGNSHYKPYKKAFHAKMTDPGVCLLFTILKSKTSLKCPNVGRRLFCFHITM